MLAVRCSDGAATDDEGLWFIVMATIHREENTPAETIMAYMVMVYTIVARTGMAYVGMAYVGMAFMVMAL